MCKALVESKVYLGVSVNLQESKSTSHITQRSEGCGSFCKSTCQVQFMGELQVEDIEMCL